MRVVLHFMQNNSIYLDRVLGIAGPEAIDRREDRHGTHYALTFTKDRLADFFDALDYAKNWESTTIEIDGRTIAPKQLREVIACYRACQKAEDPAGFCRRSQADSLFPCRAIRIDESDEHGWFRHGTLRQGALEVDKEKIARLVNAQLTRQHYYLCPLLDHNEIQATINDLPARIHPEQDEGWTYRTGWVKGRLVRTGVKKNDTREALPEGVTEASPKKPSEEEDEVRRYVPDVTYAEIGGLKRELALVRETIELPLRHPEVFARLGITPNRGVLLWGPPGTGKTLIAKAVANQCRAHLALIRGPEVKSKWHGQSESNLRQIFEDARRNAPAIVLFDEIDALVPNRATLNQDVNVSMVSQLLTLMDGIEERGHVLIIGTTNRPEAIDPAFRRPGRFDLEIEIGLPDEQALREILRIHTAKMPLAPDVNLENLVGPLCGLTGADVAALCKEAALVCLREQIHFDQDDLVVTGDLEKLKIGAVHFEQALATVLRGRWEEGGEKLHRVLARR